MKSNYVEYGGKLALVCLACMLGVGGAYVMARGRIEEGKSAAFMTSIREVLMVPADAAMPAVHPATADEGKKENKVFVSESAEHGKLLAAQGEATGYSGKVKVAVGAKVLPAGLQIVEVRVISQTETPGLGTRIAEQETNLTFWSYLGNLFGGSTEEVTDWGYLKRYREKMFTGGGLEAVEIISGATISSNATTAAAEAALEKILLAVQSEGSR